MKWNKVTLIQTQLVFEESTEKEKPPVRTIPPYVGCHMHVAILPIAVMRVLRMDIRLVMLFDYLSGHHLKLHVLLSHRVREFRAARREFSTYGSAR